jgi:hypothetical protein
VDDEESRCSLFQETLRFTQSDNSTLLDGHDWEKKITLLSGKIRYPRIIIDVSMVEKS